MREGKGLTIKEYLEVAAAKNKMIIFALISLRNRRISPNR
jgi:hypothetical protein